MADIFLSYKRSDDPGYVGRLADGLNQLFGEQCVYRDVDSERAGSNWKKSLARAVAGAQVVLAIIGPRWRALSQAADDETVDWIRFELNQARSLDVPVIPVVLAHSDFDLEQDLEDLNWLKELQFFELADGQGRWQADLARLADTIAAMTDLKVRGGSAGSTAAVAQESHGDQSPNVHSVGGDVNINFGSDSGRS